MHAHILPDNWASRLLQMTGQGKKTTGQGKPRPAVPPAAFVSDFLPDRTGHVVMPLSRMKPGQRGHILSLCETCAVRHHLLELGFTPGTEVEFVRVAPLRDPLTIRLRGYQLSLRKREAEAVTVRVCPPDFDIDNHLNLDPQAE